MTSVRIYKPAKTAMQSGRANTKAWVVEHEPGDAVRVDALMGWSGSRDTKRQVRLRFATKEEAVAYAKRSGFEYRVVEAKERSLKPKSYADNFAFKQVS